MDEIKDVLANLSLGRGAALAVALCVVAGLLLSCSDEMRNGQEQDSKVARIAVFQIVDYELIANMRRAFAEEVMNSEFAQENEVQILPHRDAHNDVNLTNQIADQIVADEPDLIYILGTPAAQALVERTRTIPIVQGAVTDPVTAKMAAGWEGSRRNYAASTDFPPVDAQFELLKEILPGAKTVGAIYSSAEDNSRALMERVRPTCKKLGYNLVERPVTSTAEVQTSATALIGNCDVIYVTTDNTVLAALPTLLEISRDNGIPVVTCTKEDVKQGALFALGVSYEELARIAARIALRILSGENPGTIPIAFIEEPELYWNVGTAERLGITLPSELHEKVAVWYRNGEEVAPQENP